LKVSTASLFLKQLRRTEAPSLNTQTLFCRSAAVLGRPRRTRPPQQETRNNSVEQKPHPSTHKRSSVGARPSSAAPVKRSPLSRNAPTKVTVNASQGISFECALNEEFRVSYQDGLFDGGGRGRPRSDRRAFVYPGEGLLFDKDGRARLRADPRVTDSIFSMQASHSPSLDLSRVLFDSSQSLFLCLHARHMLRRGCRKHSLIADTLQR